MISNGTSFAAGLATALIVFGLAWQVHECAREDMALRAASAAERWQATANAQWITRKDLIEVDDAALSCEALRRAVINDRRALVRRKSE